MRALPGGRPFVDTVAGQLLDCHRRRGIIAIRLVVTADNHLGRYYDRMPPQRLEERRAWLRRGFARAVEYALEADAHLFLQVGDLFDTPEPRNMERQFVAESLARLRSAGVRCLGIGGNHDTPRSRSDLSPATPQGSYARLGGMRLLEGRRSIDAEILEMDGARVAVGGMTPDPTLPAGADPLKGVVWRPEADLALLMVHGGLEGHIYPEAPEAILRRSTAEEMDGVQYLLVGHVHKHATFRWGDKTVIVPGATERMTFGDLDSQPGFVYMEVEPGRLLTLRHLPVESQPRRQLLLSTNDLNGRDPHEEAKERLEAICDREALVRLSLEGPITRQRYHDLHLRELAEFGAARCFFFDMNTTGLYVEDLLVPPIARGGKLSQREELIRFALESQEAAIAQEEKALVEEALRAILEEYQ